MSPVVCPDSGRIVSYSSPEVVAEAGITYRQLDYWVRLGHLKPDGSVHHGQREWSEAELEIAGRMGRLTAAGLPLAFAAAMARGAWPVGELAPGVTVTVSRPSAGYAMRVGQRMLAVRQARGMTRPQVEQASDGRFSAAMLGWWERGQKGMYVHHLAAYARWLGVDIRVLLPREQTAEATRGTGS